MANRNTVGFGLNATGTMGSNYTNQGQSNYFIDAADATEIPDTSNKTKKPAASFMDLSPQLLKIQE